MRAPRTTPCRKAAAVVGISPAFQHATHNLATGVPPPPCLGGGRMASGANRLGRPRRRATSSRIRWKSAGHANAARGPVFPILLADADASAPAEKTSSAVAQGRACRRCTLLVIRYVRRPGPLFPAARHSFCYAGSASRSATATHCSTTRAVDALDMYLRHQSPGPGREVNWLPAPKGPLGITMRLYSPKSSVLTGTWAPPAVRRSA